MDEILLVVAKFHVVMELVFCILFIFLIRVTHLYVVALETD